MIPPNMPVSLFMFATFVSVFFSFLRVFFVELTQGLPMNIDATDGHAVGMGMGMCSHGSWC